MNHTVPVLLTILLVGAVSTAQADHHELKQVARGWVEASAKSPEALAAYIEKHMADDGVFVPERYVGFGFSFDPRNDDEMVVVRVTPGTPAAAVLKAGDRFVSVAGTPATFENRDRLLFRGKPGETVKAVIERDGKQMEIAVARGVIAVETPKSESLRNIAMADPEDWEVDSLEISEVVQEGNVVFVVSEIADTEADTGFPFVERSVQRFQFNDDGKVARNWVLRESGFVLEQLGYTITR
ncbi:MAG: PDZ domain-containing protein [Pseudomonadales bacterium]